MLTATSIKMGHDIDWDDPKACTIALGKLLDQFQALGRFLEQQLSAEFKESPLAEQCGSLSELYIDCGYLGDDAIEARRTDGMRVFCKPFPLHNGGRFTKANFSIDLEAGTIRCPEGLTVEALPVPLLTSPADKVRLLSTAPPLYPRCATPRPKRHAPPSRGLPHSLRFAPPPEHRRAAHAFVSALPFEHRLAAVHNRQGDRARYRGPRKNLFDLRRYAVLKNLSSSIS